MKAAKLLFTILTVAGVAGCDKPGDANMGAGPTETSERYQGVEQPTKWEPGRNPATQPSQPAPGNAPAGNAESPIPPGGDDPDKRGTVQTPPSAFENSQGAAAGATSAPSRGTEPAGRRESEGGPFAKTDPEAKAIFQAAPGIKLKGEAELELTDKGDGVEIEIEVEDAPPGEKGLHIHEKPDCTNIPAKSMGEHFAPDHKQHGLPGGAARHLGDLGNITIDKDGKGKLEITVSKANLKQGDPFSFLGRAIVIHEKKDEGSQPSGNSGKPIACAIIKQE